ncbi:30S ribosomal protein S3 [Candidatus Nomurabacteria bacterium]|nr:30S ribosomal protein S3 [Candidatus Nomurabacteria bacterium]
MSHKVHPYSHRLGIIRDWQSRWFGTGGQFQKFLKADVLLREFLEKKLRGFAVNNIEIERGQNFLRLTIKTARPGLIIGRSGEGSTKLRAEAAKFLERIGAEIPKDFRLDIEEVKNPETYARLVAQMIAEGLEKRLPFRRVAKQALEKAMGNRDVGGVRVTLSGRLGGADIGRTETFKKGRLPLQTLRADIDFAREKAHMTYGVVGIKVWIYRGEIFAEKAK